MGNIRTGTEIVIPCLNFKVFKHDAMFLLMKRPEWIMIGAIQ